jgi:hypothetical protein
MLLTGWLVRFWRLPPARRVVLLEAIGQLITAQVALRLFPFNTLAGGLGQPQVESSDCCSSEVECQGARWVKWAIRAVVRRLPRPPRCLVQAVAAQWMLRRRRLASTLYLGVARDGSHALNAHAWVRCGEIFVTGENEYQRFQVVGRFANLPPTSPRREN